MKYDSHITDHGGQLPLTSLLSIPAIPPVAFSSNTLQILIMYFPETAGHVCVSYQLSPRGGSIIQKIELSKASTYW